MYDPYYIMVRKPEELMPPSCLFDNLDRAEVDRSVTCHVDSGGKSLLILIILRAH